MPLAPEIVVGRMLDALGGIELAEDEEIDHRAMYSMIFAALIDTGVSVRSFDTITPPEVGTEDPIYLISIAGVILEFWIFDNTIFVKRTFEGQTVHV